MELGGRGGCWIAAAALIAIEVAQGRTAEEVELLAAFFEVLGDNLSLLALQAPAGDGDS